MLHTGDHYEKRARAIRHQEFRAIANAVRGLLFGAAPRRSTLRDTPANDVDFSGVDASRTDRAA